MRQIRNADGKLVCHADEVDKAVVIIIKGFKTVVRFTADGRIEVENTKPAA
jgi:hypothetical protein